MGVSSLPGPVGKSISYGGGRGCQQILGLEIWREDGSWASGWINTPTRIGMGDIVIEGDKVSLGEGMSAPLVGMGILYLTDT